VLASEIVEIFLTFLHPANDVQVAEVLQIKIAAGRVAEIPL